MKNISIITGRTPNGERFKAYVWGQTDGHIMDWAGCNFRIKPLPGQPSKGFDTRDEAESFARRTFKDAAAVKMWAAGAGDGSFLTDERFSTMEEKDIRFDKSQVFHDLENIEEVASMTFDAETNIEDGVLTISVDGPHSAADLADEITKATLRALERDETIIDCEVGRVVFTLKVRK